VQVVWFRVGEKWGRMYIINKIAMNKNLGSVKKT
jgi:hypothetical protein